MSKKNGKEKDNPVMVEAAEMVEPITIEPPYQLCLTYDPALGNVLRKRYLKPHEIKER